MKRRMAKLSHVAYDSRKCADIDSEMVQVFHQICDVRDEYNSKLDKLRAEYGPILRNKISTFSLLQSCATKGVRGNDTECT